jgi:dipeptidyl-peptidase III
VDRQYLLEQIDDAAVVQLYADGFASLSANDKILIWHLSQAALAGRDIYWDQRYRHNLEMRAILETIVRAIRADASRFDEATAREIIRYTKLFWINTGPYNNLTARKFALKCSPDALSAAAALAGVSVPAHLHAAFFDPSSEPLVTNKSPGDGKDILAESANNLYSGVTMADLDGFEEKYGLNSRLVKTPEGLVEEVGREGGKYGREIAAICRLRCPMPRPPCEPRWKRSSGFIGAARTPTGRRTILRGWPTRSRPSIRSTASLKTTWTREA